MDRFLAKPGGGQPRPDASTSGKRPLLPGTQTTLRDCAKVVILDRRDDPAEAAAALLPTLTDPAAPPGAQLDALRRLACLRFVDRGLLAGTGVGAAVRRLKRSPDVEVALSAARLVDKWKALVLDELAQARRAVARGA